MILVVCARKSLRRFEDKKGGGGALKMFSEPRVIIERVLKMELAMYLN